MDTSEFDQQAHAHLNTYNSFMNGAKIVGAAVIPGSEKIGRP